MNSETNPDCILPVELHDLLEEGKPLLLLDVMDEECFAENHIAGAERACVYETTFVEQVRALTSDIGTTIVVYGTSGQSRASEVAAEKLRVAGYTQVRDLRGGVEEWRASGYAVTSDRPAVMQEPCSGTFALDLEKSVVRWTGRNLLNHHEGTVRFSSGEIAVKDGVLERARFVVDLRTIVCADLVDSSWNAMLISHLMDADFFDVAKWPLAEFVSASAQPIDDATPGAPNCNFTGNLSLRGQAHELYFAAVVGLSDDTILAGQAEIDLDRTRWGALYGSGKFFDRLSKHLVNDLIHLHLKILANRVA